MPVEDGPDSTGPIVPASSTIVVVQQGIKRQGQVPVRRLPNLGQLPGGPVGVQQFMKHLDARTVAEKLAGREQVYPFVHAVHLVAAIVVGHVADRFARYDVEGFPLRQFLGQPRLDLGAVVVLGPRRPIAPHPLLARAAGLGSGQHAFLCRVFRLSCGWSAREVTTPETQ